MFLDDQLRKPSFIDASMQFKNSEWKSIGQQRQLFIDYHYNIQMVTQKQQFLFVLLLTLIVESQVLSPVSNCFGNCIQCAYNELSLCKGQQGCQQSYYNLDSQGSCLISPTKQVIWAQLGQRNEGTPVPKADSWGESSKQSVCSYNSASGKKTIDILGVYSGVAMLDKTFEINRDAQFFEFSFNLLRDQWMPFNDFLLIDLSSNGDSVQSLEISYQERKKVQAQANTIICSGTRVLSQKFSIKIQNNGRLGDTLTIVFTSFLYNSHWAISNIKLVSGCANFSLFDSNTKTCSRCDADSYVALANGAQKYCEKCPSLCKSCKSKTECITCSDGTQLNKGTCSFGQQYKTQQIATISGVTCGKYAFSIISGGSKATHPALKNTNDQLFDQVQLQFKLFYNPNDWTQNSDKIIIRINKAEAFVITTKNLTNKGTSSCSQFKKRLFAMIQFITPKKIQNDNSMVVEIELASTNKELQIGYSAISVKSIKRSVPVIVMNPPVQKNQMAAINDTSAVNKNDTLDKNNITLKDKANITQTPLNNSVSNEKAINQSKLDNQTKNESISDINQTDQNVLNKTDQNITNIATNQNDTKQNLEKNQETDSSKNVTANITTKPENSDNISNLTNITKLDQLNNSVDSNNTQESGNKQLYSTQQNIGNKNVENESQAEKKQESITSDTNLENQDTDLQQQTPDNNINDSNQSKSSGSQTHTSNGTIKPEQPSKIAYIPTSTEHKSGLYLVVTNAQILNGENLQVQINKLPKQSYSIQETYFVEKNIHIFVGIEQSFTNAELTVYKTSTARLLQSSERNILAVVQVNRFDSLSQNQIFSIGAFSIVFQIFAWLAVILIFVSVLSGYGIIMEQYAISLQLLFLHAYIAAEYLPLTFRDVIGGLNILENFNFFAPAHSNAIQQSWLGDLIQNGPIRFYLFNIDINFTREFYPIIIVNIIYALWFLGLYLTRRCLFKKDLIDEQKPLYYKMVENIILRPINFIDQIWRYQFLATVWCCFVQFYNLSYPKGNSGQMANALLCVFSFAITLLWPCWINFYCRKQYYENQYSQYLYQYEDIYYKKIPEYFLPSDHHRIGYPIVRSIRLFLFGLIIAYLGQIGWLTLLGLILLHLFEIAYAKHFQIYSQSQYFGHKLVENVLFSLIELILFFLSCFSQLALSDAYIYIGFVLSGLSLLIILNSSARTILLIRMKCKQIFDDEEDFVPQVLLKQPKTERVV